MRSLPTAPLGGRVRLILARWISWSGRFVPTARNCGGSDVVPGGFTVVSRVHRGRLCALVERPMAGPAGRVMMLDLQTCLTHHTSEAMFDAE